MERQSTSNGGSSSTTLEEEETKTRVGNNLSIYIRELDFQFQKDALTMGFIHVDREYCTQA